MSEKYVTAVDLGAESGRVMRVGFDGKHFTLKCAAQFPNKPVLAGDTLHWDILNLWHNTYTWIDANISATSSIGVDAWGNDFGLLDRQGTLLSNPVHYRDKRTQGMTEWISERVPLRTIFERTGIQYLPLNGLYQIASMVRDNSPLLDCAATFLTMPDLFNYWLTGERVGEYTNATTTQCYNPRQRNWDKETLTQLGIPTHIFPATVQPGTQIGTYQNVPVLAPACHDTGSAVVAIPTTTDEFAYLSSGTWSLLGLEVEQPIINDAAFEANVTNEGGVYGTIRLLKNVMGLWLAQECRATWQTRGTTYSYDELVDLASQAAPFRSLIDPDHAMFVRGGDMPARIQDFCRQSAQPVPENVGEVMRCIFESLALKYRFVLEKLLSLTQRTVQRLHIVGGGSQNTLLCQMTADCTGLPVYAGPVEATALGNGIVQLIALGEIADLEQAREILSKTSSLTPYEPQNRDAWQTIFERFLDLLGE